MMRALWTAASGMTTQQTNVDVIANNLSNARKLKSVLPTPFKFVKPMMAVYKVG